MIQTSLASINLILWKLLLEYGLDPVVIFRRAGLDPSVMQNPSSRYPTALVNRLWVEVDGVVEDRCFPLRCMDLWHPTYFGTLGYAMLESWSLRESLARLERFQKLLCSSRMVQVQEEREAGLVRVIILFNEQLQTGLSTAEDFDVAILLSICRVNFPGDLAPTQVHFQHQRNSCHQLYCDTLGCTPTYGQAETSFTLRISDVDRRLPAVDERLSRFKELMLIQELDVLEQDTAIGRIQGFIRHRLAGGTVTLQMIAGDMGMSRRSLQRLLAQSDLSFASLLDEIRIDQAKHYLCLENMDFTEIAFLIGFADLSSFSRAFKRVTGVSPTTYRDDLRNDQALKPLVLLSPEAMG